MQEFEVRTIEWVKVAQVHVVRQVFEQASALKLTEALDACIRSGKHEFCDVPRLSFCCFTCSFEIYGTCANLEVSSALGSQTQRGKHPASYCDECNKRNFRALTLDHG